MTNDNVIEFKKQRPQCPQQPLVPINQKQSLPYNSKIQGYWEATINGIVKLQVPYSMYTPSENEVFFHVMGFVKQQNMKTGPIFADIEFVEGGGVYG